MRIRQTTNIRIRLLINERQMTVIKTAWRISFRLPHEEPKKKYLLLAIPQRQVQMHYPNATSRRRGYRRYNIQWPGADCVLLYSICFPSSVSDRFYWSKRSMALMQVRTSAVWSCMVLFPPLWVTATHLFGLLLVWNLRKIFKNTIILTCYMGMIYS